MSVYIDHFSCALGECAESVEDAERNGLLRTDAAALREAGFEYHHRCAPGASVYQLAKRAVASIEDRLSGVNAVIYATCIPENGSLGGREGFTKSRDVKHLMHFPASRLQVDFGLGGALVVGLNQQACTGMLGAVRLARSLLTAEPETERVLCVTADRFPDGALYEQTHNLISDGAAACVVSRESAAFRLMACHHVTVGSLVCATEEETAGAFFGYAHRTIAETLSRSGLRIEDIRWVVPQNTHRDAWRILARLTGFFEERVYMPTLPEAGHVISGDNVLNLKHLLESGNVQAGEKVLLFMAGYGANFQSLVLERAA